MQQTMQTANEKAIRVLPEGEVFAVRVNGAYFHSFDEDGFVLTHALPHCVSGEQAEETARKVRESGHTAEVVPVSSEDRTKGMQFWLSSDEDGFSERTLHVGSPVRSRYENIPCWFKASMMKFSPEGTGYRDWNDEEHRDGDIALDIFLEQVGFQNWLDHWGWTGEGENSILVSEPYELGSENIQELIETCAKFDFNFHITGQSVHYPSSTLRIEVEPKTKLAYTRPIRVLLPGQKEWEDKRNVVFNSIVR